MVLKVIIWRLENVEIAAAFPTATPEDHRWTGISLDIVR